MRRGDLAIAQACQNPERDRTASKPIPARATASSDRPIHPHESTKSQNKIDQETGRFLKDDFQRSASTARSGSVDALIRPSLKALIQKHRAEAVNIQKISAISNTVVPEGAIDDPLAFEPPKLIGADWNGGRLTLNFDRTISSDWVQALRNMGNYTAVWGVEPQRFSFSGATGSVECSGNDAQRVIDHFKEWLPRVTQVLKYKLEHAAQERRAAQLAKLRAEKEALENRLKINQNLRV